MSDIKITQALCQWISDAGGTVTGADEKSVLHALRSLYVALGGELPENAPQVIAPWINGIESVAGGGVEPTITLSKVIIHNTTSATGTFIGCKVRDRGEGAYDVESQTLAIKANDDLEAHVTCNSSYINVEDWENAVYYAGRLALKKSSIADPTKVVASISRGSCALVRNPSRDSSTMYAYVLDMSGSEGETIVITISESA